MRQSQKEVKYFNAVAVLEPGSDERMTTYTAEDAIEHLGLGWFQWKVILFSCVFSVWCLFCCHSNSNCEIQLPNWMKFCSL